MTARPDTPHIDVAADAREVVVYTRPGCPYCFTLRAGLRRSGVTFQEINIWADPDAAAFVRSVANGNETVPTVVVGDVHMINPSARRVSAVASDASGRRPPKRRPWFRRSAPTGAAS